MPFDISTGFVPRPSRRYFALYQEAARESLGTDVDLGPESPLGQLLGALATRDVQIQERLLAISNGLSRQRAVGYQLDDLYSIFGLYRDDATRSTVTATLGGAAGTVVPAGRRAATRTGSNFRLQANAIIGSGGTVDALMEAADTGPIAVAAGELDRIVDIVPGWETVTNAAEAVPGRDREPTPTYRNRGARETDINALGGNRAISAAVYRAGATDVIVRRNSTSADLALRGSTILAKGVLVIAAGGTNAAIADAINDSVAAGISTGTGTVTISTEFGDVQFSRPTDVAVSIVVAITIDTTLFPGNGLTLARDAIAAYINAQPIGGHLDANQIIIAVYRAIPGGGVLVTATPTAENSGGDDLTDQANVDLVERLRVAVADITINVT